MLQATTCSQTSLTSSAWTRLVAKPWKSQNLINDIWVQIVLHAVTINMQFIMSLFSVADVACQLTMYSVCLIYRLSAGFKTF